MHLLTPRLLIREFTQGDLDAFSDIENDPQMRQFEKGMPDREAAQSYLDWAIRKATETPRTHYRMAITIPQQDKVIGRTGLTSQNPEIREWEIGWAVAVPHWGKGYASEAARRMLALAFEELDAHRVVAFCHAGNTASSRVMEKIGLQKEGYLRQTRWFNEHWADELVYAIIESDLPLITGGSGGAGS